MLRGTGICSGIDYSMHLAGHSFGCTPHTILEYFPKDFMIFVDESHITLPQVRGMYAGDQARKASLVDYGFRLPSARENRPLNFNEFESFINQMLFVSATPGPYESEHELLRAEQVIRPTGLLDPEISVRPVEGQIDDLITEIRKQTAKKTKGFLITTLTKRLWPRSDRLSTEIGIRISTCISDVDTLERSRLSVIIANGLY